jgi:hypothetical protein
MLRQRLCTTRGRLLLLIACTLTTLACPTGEALATVPVNGPSGWQTGGFTVTVTDGYSYNNGATMSCSDSGGNSYMTYYGAGPNSGGVLMEQQQRRLHDLLRGWSEQRRHPDGAAMVCPE